MTSTPEVRGAIELNVLGVRRRALDRRHSPDTYLYEMVLVAYSRRTHLISGCLFPSKGKEHCGVLALNCLHVMALETRHSSTAIAPRPPA